MKPLLFLASTLLLHAATYASAETLTVYAKDNIFGAGRLPGDDTPSPSGPANSGANGGGVPPVVFSFTARPGQVLSFSSVTGHIWMGDGPESGPDGFDHDLNILSYEGIAGIRTPTTGYLAGVFLDDNVPAGMGPTPLDFSASGINFTVLELELGQVFFIGDGLSGTGSGAVQQFKVPATATRLFLGIVDGRNGQGPGAYDNNGPFPGSSDSTFTASFAITTALPPCDGAWKNHGEYVSAVAKAVEQQLAEGLITQEQADELMSEAGQSDCGKNKK